MRQNDTPAIRILALACLVTMLFALCFSQRAREMITGLSGSPALRQHLAGRRLLLTSFHAAPSAKFEAYDGRTNSAWQIDGDVWLAGGFVTYAWQGSPRRDRWSCAFDARRREVLALEVGPTREATPEFSRKLEALRRGERERPRADSTAGAIEEKWGWQQR